MQAAWASDTSSFPSGDDAYQAGMALMQQKRFPEAIRAFQEGLRIQPTNPELLNALGATYSLSGEAKDAMRCFQEALRHDPQFIPAHKNLGIEYFRTRQDDLASAEFEKLASDPASRPIANLFLGIIATRKQEYEQGAKLLQASGSLTWQYSEGVLALACSLQHLGRPQESLLALSHLEEVPDVSATDYLDAAVLYTERSEYERALQSIEKAGQIDPALSQVDYQRALVLDLMGQTDRAREGLIKSTRAKPDASSLNLLAHVAEKTGDFQLAIQSLRTAAKLAPSREENYLDYSTLCMDSGNLPLSLQATEVGLRNIPGSYRLTVQKGAVLDKMGNHKEAEQVLRSALPLEKNNSEAIVSLAITEVHDHRLQDAFGTLESGLKSFPGNYYLNYYLGNVLVQMGESQGSLEPGMTASAERALHRAIQLNPTFADSYFQLGKLYLNTKPDLAEEYLKKCLKLDSKHAPAVYALGRLYLKTGKREQGQKLLAEYVSLQEAEKLNEQRTPRLELSQH
jgi:tetratricopeptide (TPR) repeat protein